jgi:hypothetical protein
MALRPVRVAFLTLAAITAVAMLYRAGVRDAHADGSQNGKSPAVALLTSSSGTVVSAVREGTSFTLQGDGFAAGAVMINLDGPFGLPLGTAEAGADGRIRIPLVMLTDVAGQHTIVAREMSGGQTLQAGVCVMVQTAP